MVHSRRWTGLLLLCLVLYPAALLLLSSALVQHAADTNANLGGISDLSATRSVARQEREDNGGRFGPERGLTVEKFEADDGGQEEGRVKSRTVWDGFDFERFLKGRVPELYRLPKAEETLPVIDCGSIPSAKYFWRHFVKPNRAAILRNCVSVIPDLKWVASSSELVQHLNDPVVDCESRPRGVKLFTPESTVVTVERMRLSEYFARRLDPARKTELYLAQLNVPVGNPPFGGRKLEEGADGTSKLLWMGTGGEVSPNHFDWYDNIYVVVGGTKRLTISPPSSTPYLYPVQLGDGQPGNDVIQAQADVVNPDYDRFPLLRKAQIFDVDVEAGDALYIPAFWWHRMEGKGPTASVSYWLQEVHSATGIDPSLVKLYDRFQAALDTEARRRWRTGLVEQVT